MSLRHVKKKNRKTLQIISHFRRTIEIEVSSRVTEGPTRMKNTAVTMNGRSCRSLRARTASQEISASAGPVSAMSRNAPGSIQTPPISHQAGSAREEYKASRVNSVKL
jgi:hypothetical protein